MFNKRILIALLFISIFISLAPQLYAQEEEGEIIIISQRVGKEIDLEERNRYKLFPSPKGFKSAIVLKLSDGSYIFKITYLDEKSGEKKIKRTVESESKIIQLREYIDHFEDIKKGKFSYKTEDVESSLEEIYTDSLVSISLKDGTTLKGRIVQKDDTTISVVTPGGLEAKVPKSSIISIKSVRGRMVEGIFHRSDPNYSRLMFAPTGRPLRRGEGYFSDYYIFFPGISYGFTNQITMMAGFSVLPGAGLDNQLKYVAPKIGIQASDKLAVSMGALYISAGDVAAGIAFAVGSIGQQDKSFTVGIGLGYTKEEEEDFKFAEHPIIMLGGNIRLSNNTAFVSENWFITGSELKLSQQPLCIALRFFGDRMAVDIGAIIIGEIIKEGFPIPWLSFVYNFGM